MEEAPAAAVETTLPDDTPTTDAATSPMPSMPPLIQESSSDSDSSDSDGSSSDSDSEEDSVPQVILL